MNFLENTDTCWRANFHFNGASFSFLVFGQNTFKVKASLRAGGGLSNLIFEIDGAFSASDSTGGFGILGGIGYAFWLGKRFNLTLNIDHSRQFYEGGNDPDHSQFTSFYV